MKVIKNYKEWKNLALFTACYFSIVLVVFIFIQKPLFLIFAVPEDVSLNISDVMNIYRHGFPLDLAAAGYISALPLLLMFAGIWTNTAGCLVKVLKIYNIIISLILAIIIVADCAIYPFWGFKFDSTVLLYMYDIDKVGQNVSWTYIAVSLIGIIVLAVIIWYVLTLVCRMWVNESVERRTKAWKAVQIIEFIVLAGLLFANMRGIGIWPKTPATAYYSGRQFFNHAANNPLFNFVYSLSHKANDFKEFRFYDSELTAQDVKQWFDVENDSTELLIDNRRPDILLITIEGMGACFIDKLGGKKGITPNIDKLIDESFSFTNCYASSFRTDRGLVSILSGFPGQPTTSAMRYTHVLNALPGIAKSLAGHAGYSTTAMLGGDASFFNMREYMLASGHKEIIDIFSFPENERTTKWGVPDHLLFKRALKELNDRNEDKPAYTFLLTQSSHTPFDVPYNKFQDKVLNAFAYTDEALGNFIEDLKKTPVWDRLMVVVTADHGYLYGESSDPDFHHIPLFITGGAVNKIRKEPRIVSQTDIAAIILGQLGLPHSDYLYSRNVLSSAYTEQFSFSTFNNGFTYRDSTGVTVYDNVTSKPIHYPDSVRTRKGKEILQSVYETLYNLSSKKK